MKNCAKQNLQQLLNKNRVYNDDKPATHLSYGEFNGKFHLDHETRKEFMKLYQEAIKDGVNDMSILERQKEYAHILVDIDIEKPLDKYVEGTRLYDNKMIQDVVQAYESVFEDILQYKKDDTHFFIQEKEKPTIKNTIVKDGFHIVVPNVIAKADIRHNIRNRVVKILHNSNCFKGIDVEKAVDKAVVSTNGWFLYGSVKPVTLSGYKVTKYYYDEKWHVSKFSDKTLIKYLSLQSSSYIEKNAAEVIKAPEASEAVKPIEPFNPSQNQPNTKLFEYLNALSDERAGDYEHWSRIGWIIHNTVDKDGLKMFDDFSKRCAKKYNELDVYKFYTSIKKRDSRNVTFATLVMMVKEDNPEEFNRLNAKYNTKTELNNEYTTWKQEFEKYHFKIMNPPSYGCIDVVQDNKLFIISKEDLIKKYEHLNFKTENRKGDNVKVSLINEWVKDENIRKVNHVDFLPTQTVDPNKIYNTAKDYVAVSKPVDRDVKFETTLIYKHIRNLCNNDDKSTTFFINFLANIVQHPQNIPRTSIIFKSVEGCGKDLFFNYFGKQILGQDYHSCTSSIENYFGTYTGALNKKVLLVLNETTIDKTRSMMETIKDFITTTDKLTINPKMDKQFQINNNVSYIFLTNNDFPLVISQKDRRFTAIECNNAIANDLEGYFKPLMDEMRGEKIDGVFYQYLKNINLTKYDFTNERPITDLYQHMKQCSLPIHIRFLADRVDDYIKALEIKNKKDKKNSKFFNVTAMDLFEDFSYWCTTNKLKFEMNSTSFGLKLKSLSCFEKKRSNTGIVYVVDLVTLKRTLIQENAYEMLPDFIE